MKQSPVPYTYKLLKQGVDYRQTAHSIDEFVYPNQKQIIKISTILLFAFATAFFPRVLDNLGAPAPINYLHLLIVPLCCIYAVITAQHQNSERHIIARDLLSGLGILLIIGFASALLNEAGFINVVFDFLMATEPFILLLGWISIPLTKSGLKFIFKWFVRFSLFNLLLALYHGPAHGFGDPMQGVFYRSGSGHVVASSVIITFGLFYFLFFRNQSLWLRGLVLGASFVHLILADAKQVMLTLILGFILLALINMKNVGKAISILILGIVLICVFYWAIYTFPFLKPFTTWIRPEIYQPDGEATLLKTSGVRIILEHYTSPLNWLLGLGPGHTIDRLGFTILDEHSYLLEPLGSTVSDVSLQVKAAREASWLGDQSSFFSPFWGWAAIWGDLGVLGLGAYLFLCSVVWRRLCPDNFSRFILLTVMLHGFIFTQLEEPGYMLFIATLIGLRWHQARLYST